MNSETLTVTIPPVHKAWHDLSDSIPDAPLKKIQSLATEFHCQNSNELCEGASLTTRIFSSKKSLREHIKENKQYGAKFSKPEQCEEMLTYAYDADGNMCCGTPDYVVNSDCDEGQADKNTFMATIWETRET